MPRPKDKHVKLTCNNSCRRLGSRASMVSTKVSLNADNLSFLNIIVPDRATMERYEEFAKLNINQMLQLKKRSRELILFRSWLLPMPMDGQATVSQQAKNEDL